MLRLTHDSKRNPLHVVHKLVNGSPIINPGGTWIGVASHGLSSFNCSAVLEIGRDSSAADWVVTYLRFDVYSRRPRCNHTIGILL